MIAGFNKHSLGSMNLIIGHTINFSEKGLQGFQNYDPSKFLTQASVDTLSLRTRTLHNEHS